MTPAGKRIRHEQFLIEKDMYKDYIYHNFIVNIPGVGSGTIRMKVLDS